MKLLFVAHYSQLYGANRSLLENLAFIKRTTEYEIHVVIPQAGPLVDEVLRLKCHAHLHPFHWSQHLPTDLSLRRRIAFLRVYWKDVRAFAGLIIQIKPDVVYTNSSVVDSSLIAAKLCRVPHIWHFREFLDFYNIHHFLGSIYFRLLVRVTDFRVFVSKALAVHYNQKPDGKRSQVVYNDISRSSFTEVIPVEHEASEIVLGYAGSLHPSKGVGELIEAFASLQKARPMYAFRLKLFGDGDEEFCSLLRSRVSELGLDPTVEFCGFRADQAKVYAAFDILVLPSAKEAFGRVVIEAMLSGRVVVAKGTGALPELVTHGVNGILYRGGAGQLLGALESLIDTPGYRQELTRTALDYARTKFPPDACGQALVRIIEIAAHKSF